MDDEEIADEEDGRSVDDVDEGFPVGYEHRDAGEQALAEIDGVGKDHS